MVTYDALNSHFEYMEVTRHWSSTSQKYAGGDALVTLFSRGWKIEGNIYFEEFWHSGTRPVVIYHLNLVRHDETVQVPVLVNPYVRRIIAALPVQILPMDARSKHPQH